MYDLVIIGMGPAGLTAAVYAARKKLSTLLIGKQYGGQMAWASGVENYIGFQYITGSELLSKFEDHVKQYPVKRVEAEVVKLTRENGHFITSTAGGEEFHSRAVIVASGKVPRRLNAPGERELTGRGVSYCAVCDAPLFAGMDVAVVGGGNSALTAAYDLIKIAKQVYVVSQVEWTADPILVDKVKNAPNLTKLVGYETVRIEGNERVAGITLRSLDGRKEEKRIPVQGVFIEIGTVPSTHFVEGLLELNEKGEIKVDCDCSTSVPGAFAAGDVSSIPEKQIIVAAGEGAKAALGAYRYLLNQ
ncbi:alkyl hydroperoxide reductase subunit F [Desulfofundulus luciae]|uniref:Alkyl hydroperoxide reductase subunit F n=1 Tax=Desulfofundulus luciae TaxID=74702 RepID=A0ABU0B116_9FIRM|nr:FAD-dependent oxidoreductase [Desulfofundulus luciae]MDQ0286423.1 alkyl hydroperoxide reductase subunit F [Desulfofundulus luciae]